MSYFIEMRPSGYCWNTRQIITESQFRTSSENKKIGKNMSMDEILKTAIMNNMKSERKRAHVGIRRDADRYQNRRITHTNAEGKLEARHASVATQDEDINTAVSNIFTLVPAMKGSNSFTGYVRYSLTNRWTTLKQFSNKEMDKLAAAVQSNDENAQKAILDEFVKKNKINEAAKNKFLAFDTENKNKNVEAWRKMFKITNPFFNKQSCQEFNNADEAGKIAILKKWALVTQSTNPPSIFLTRYLNNAEFVNSIIADAHKNNAEVKDEVMQKLQDGSFEREARAQGLTDDDMKLAKDILASLHDTHRDLRDYAPEELADKENYLKDRINSVFKDGDSTAEEDWSQDDLSEYDEDEESYEEDAESEDKKLEKYLNWRYGGNYQQDYAPRISNSFRADAHDLMHNLMKVKKVVDDKQSINTILNQLAYNSEKYTKNKHGIHVHIAQSPDGDDELDDYFYIRPRTRDEYEAKKIYRCYALKPGPFNTMIIDKTKDFDISAAMIDNIDLWEGDITINLEMPVSLPGID